ncbi:uncharacterized protein LOC116359314 [Oncorhynchus kisutch]|uniref:uncharacterized protein LOC116359314 n=1 Tax=Oncorhynchus kisutch TaxID=8019 RepID=UPI0012DC45E5|nr:uncharacterized protein LOC116359314 [Oncorhynchus kisutch]
MAYRKSVNSNKRGKGMRTGLRSQQQHQLSEKVPEVEPGWNTMESSGEEEVKYEKLGARPRGQRQPELGELLTEGAVGGPEPHPTMVTLFQQLFTCLERRDEDLKQELRGLRQSILTAPHQAELVSESPRLGLPTPGRQRLDAAGTSTPQQAPQAVMRPAPGDQSSSVNVHLPAFLRKEPKMPSYQQGEDIENYLLRFERMAKTWQWPEVEWACRLVPLLTGKALEAYTAMDEGLANVYKGLKEALLVKFDISPETYRQRFRAASTPSGESPTETYHRLKGLYRRWVRPGEKTQDEIGEVIILEQLLQVLPHDIRTWVREHEPKDGLMAAKLALQYLNARKGGPPQPAAPAPRSLRDTRDIRNARDGGGNSGGYVSGREVRDHAVRSDGRGLTCFYCRQQGHKASMCPLRKSKLSGYCYVPREGDGVQNRQTREGSCLVPVKVNGKSLTAMIDTGSSLSLIRKGNVPVNDIDYGHQTLIQCVHGDQSQQPTAELTVEIQGQKYLLKVGVMEKLPFEMILGRDVPVLSDLLGSVGGQLYEQSVCQSDVQMACSVVTRAQAKAGLQPLPDLCDSLCEGGTKGPRKSRRQRRLEKYVGTPVPVADVSGLEVQWDVPQNFATLQKSDATLKCLFDKALAGDSQSLCGGIYTVDNHILYLGSEADSRKLVVPSTCRPLVLNLAHTVPWAGHLGQHKTYLRLGSRFFWPSMYTDVQKYCKSCPTCQKTSAVRRSERAPLCSLPVISTPFKRIAMDIVGPLEKSSAGYKYILVICDYATRFPEAFPLRSITTPKIISALVQLFSRVGIPDEILTDQGTNFTSRLMVQLHRQLGIKGLRTTPYHPQTDGLVERFNQTLKNMLRKFVADTGKDWDKWLPFLLFAYREVPQASTGFSPFELLYGWPVQGPLDLLKKCWEGSPVATSGQGIVQYVLQMRDRLERYREEARANLQLAQKAQKRGYDQHARHREFEPGQKVLLLLPSSTSKLLAQWQGPYLIGRKMGPVTYEVLHPDKGKKKQTYHVNLLKAWEEKEELSKGKSFLVRRVEEDESDGVTEAWKERAEVILAHLEEDKQDELKQLFGKYPALFSQRPGRTKVLEHVIRLKPGQNPVRQHPYRVPERLVVALKEEVHTMIEMDVVEPSSSEWSSPIVIVPKKDGSLRVCMDFRKVNAISQFDAYPMPRIDDLLERIGRAHYITTLDLCKGYWQVPLDEQSKAYTAFRTPMGLFQFKVMPFGLHGAPATFQRLMDKVLQDCDDYCAAYLDDVVIYSHSWEEHIQHLSSVLGKIHEAGLTLNLLKCEWAKQETKYLGYQLGKGEVRPQVEKVESIRNSPQPRTKTQVKSFLGLAGWYRRFIPQFSTIAVPLTNLTSKGASNPVKWTEECEEAFMTLKKRLCSFPVLQTPDFKKRFLVQVDASAVGIGAVLAQGEPGEELPVLYLSRKLLPRETRYSTIEKECLAIKWALDSLRYYLLGREFDLHTDHRALTWIQTMKDRNSRVTRWYLELQPFRFCVRHKAGKENVTADYLSRLPNMVASGEEEGNVT